MPNDPQFPVPKKILELVERFRDHSSAYKAHTYNETQTRREFLDPFFSELGWNVENTDGYAEAYKDVVHEDAIKIGEATKAPDYSFRIGGTRKFFLEAKTVCEHKNRHERNLPAAAVRMDYKTPTEHREQLRGLRGLRLPRQA